MIMLVTKEDCCLLLLTDKDVLVFVMMMLTNKEDYFAWLLTDKEDKDCFIFMLTNKEDKDCLSFMLIDMKDHLSFMSTDKGKNYLSSMRVDKVAKVLDMTDKMVAKSFIINWLKNFRCMELIIQMQVWHYTYFIFYLIYYISKYFNHL